MPMGCNHAGGFLSANRTVLHLASIAGRLPAALRGLIYRSLMATVYNKLCVICEMPHGRWPHSPRAAFCGRCMRYAEKLRGKAHGLVGKAIKEGKLPSPKGLPCDDCGKPSMGYEHRDYARPLDVVPICFTCNSNRWVAKYPKPYPIAA